MDRIRKEHKSLSDDVLKWFVEMNLLKLVLGMDTSLFSGSYIIKTLDTFMNGRDFVPEDISIKTIQFYLAQDSTEAHIK